MSPRLAWGGLDFGHLKYLNRFYPPHAGLPSETHVKSGSNSCPVSSLFHFQPCCCNTTVSQSRSTLSFVNIPLLGSFEHERVTGRQIAFFPLYKTSSDSSSLHFEGSTMNLFKPSPRGPPRKYIVNGLICSKELTAISWGKYLKDIHAD